MYYFPVGNRPTADRNTDIKHNKKTISLYFANAANEDTPTAPYKATGWQDACSELLRQQKVTRKCLCVIGGVRSVSYVMGVLKTNSVNSTNTVERLTGHS